MTTGSGQIYPAFRNPVARLRNHVLIQSVIILTRSKNIFSHLPETAITATRISRRFVDESSIQIFAGHSESVIFVAVNTESRSDLS